MSKKPKASNWAANAVAKMSDAEVLHWCKRIGLRPPNPAAVSPIERMVDEAVKSRAKRKAGR